MNITEKATIVLREIDANTALPDVVKAMLKTAIGGLLNVACVCVGHPHFHAESALISLCDQWQGREETK